MDIKEFTKSLDGKQYGYPQFTKEEIQIAKIKKSDIRKPFQYRL